MKKKLFVKRTVILPSTRDKSGRKVSSHKIEYLILERVVLRLYYEAIGSNLL